MHQKDYAISPVVGIMMLLAVEVIVVGIVIGFITGMFPGIEIAATNDTQILGIVNSSDIDTMMDMTKDVISIVNKN